MNAHLTSKPQLRIGETILEFRRKKNRVTVAFLSNGSPLVGKNLFEINEYNLAEYKYLEAENTYKILPANIIEPIPPEKTPIRGYAYCSPDDEFDMVFGMRKAIFDAFENYTFTKEFRKLIIETFDATYGRGVCNPKTKKEVAYTKFDVPLTKVQPTPNIAQAGSHIGIGSLIFLGTENAQDVERLREMMKTLRDGDTKQKRFKELEIHWEKFKEIRKLYPHIKSDSQIIAYCSSIPPELAIYNSIDAIKNSLEYNVIMENAFLRKKKEFEEAVKESQAEFLRKRAEIEYGTKANPDCQ